ncbi:hypothetical protein BAR24066_07380 [Burkholderia arboris]|uniref:Uncharacterized protein n=1 Tax=Burkholderia arboris TaxID=488730 RepID=A0A9Q9SRP6_9BURK|nr:hypothetical protein [Burkholderia arboris]VWC46152.1 hypothetical protein BAR24066_07380 [Burkholderia arboris]
MTQDSTQLAELLRNQCRSLRGDPAEVDATHFAAAAAVAAWNDFQANGLHVTFEEADAWLAKLEAGEDAEPPKCHGRTKR